MASSGSANAPLITIARFSDQLSVHLAASKLESEGVHVVVEDPPQTVGEPHHAELKVLKKDRAKAVAILETTPARESLVDEDES